MFSGAWYVLSKFHTEKEIEGRRYNNTLKIKTARNRRPCLPDIKICYKVSCCYCCCLERDDKICSNENTFSARSSFQAFVFQPAAAVRSGLPPALQALGADGCQLLHAGHPVGALFWGPCGSWPVTARPSSIMHPWRESGVGLTLFLTQARIFGRGEPSPYFSRSANESETLHLDFFIVVLIF